MGVGHILRGIRWRWALLVGAAVALVAFTLLFAIVIGHAIVLSVASGGKLEGEELAQHALQFARPVAFWGLPVLFALLTVGAGAWNVGKFGASVARDGMATGLLAAVGVQLIGRAFGPFSLRELTVYPALGLLGGWLGSVAGKVLLARHESLYRASEAIGYADDPREVAAAIGQHLARPSEDRVTLWGIATRAWDDGPLELEMLGAWPSRAEVWPSGSLDAVRVPALSSLRRRSPRVIAGHRGLPASEREAWRKMGLRSALLVPFGVSGGGPDGLLVVASRRRRNFSRGKTRAYMTAGAQASLALENLRLVEQARYSGMLGERKRLAREIHDTLIQGFASIAMNLEAAEGALENGSSTPDPTTSRRHLDEARRTAREGLVEARRIVWALRPEALENAQLPEALKRLAGRWSEDGAAAEVTVTGTPRSLSPEAEVTLLRAAQEALTNVRKHARASRVVLTLSYLGDRVMLDVLDDGVGFEREAGGTTFSGDGGNGGFGLAAMRERVEQSGGSLLVESEPGRGTTLAIDLPAVEPSLVDGWAKFSGQAP